MMNSNGTTSSSTHRALASSARPTYMSVSATYRGFREWRNGPVSTSAVVGNVGLTFVPARSMTARPQNATRTPSARRTPPAQFRAFDDRTGCGATHCSRNPLANALWVLLLVVPLLFIMHYGVVRREERYLEAKFGDAYRASRSRVRR